MSEEVIIAGKKDELGDFYQGEELITVKIRRKDVKLLQEMLEERRAAGAIRRRILVITSVLVPLIALYNFWPTVKAWLQ